MEEKIMEGLVGKYPDIDPKILQRIAAKKAASVTEESQIPSLVDGIGFNDVLQFHGDYRAGEAVFSYKKKQGGTENRHDNTSSDKEEGKDESKTKADEDRFAQLEREIETLRKEKEQKDRELIISRAADKVPGFPKSLLSDINFPANASEEDVINKLTGIRQTLIDNGLPRIEPETKATNEEAMAAQCQSLVDKYSTKAEDK